jgi:hypothetical protein
MRNFRHDEKRLKNKENISTDVQLSTDNRMILMSTNDLRNSSQLAINGPTSQIQSISDQIKESDLDFIENLTKFQSLKTRENLIKEFEKLVKVDRFSSNVETMFSKLGSILRVGSKNNKLSLLDYISIVKEIEKKVQNKYNKGSILLQVRYFKLFLLNYNY